MSGEAGALFVISAPSGAGKSTLIGRLMAVVPGLAFSVSWTTRLPRPGEVDGVHYHFTNEARFREMIAKGELLEWAEVHGKLYGTGRAETAAALSRGVDLVLDIDVQGAAQVRASGMAATFIFILPPDYDTMVARLRGRGTEDGATIARRLQSAAVELPRWREFDYLVVNDDLEAAAAELIAVVRAARARVERRGARAAAIVATLPSGAVRP